MSCTGNDSEAQDSQTNKPIVALRTVGLNNLGNTCYFNAAVQCLARARPLRQALKGLVLDENGPNILAKGGSAPVSRELFATLRGLTKVILSTSFLLYACVKSNKDNPSAICINYACQ